MTRQKWIKIILFTVLILGISVAVFFGRNYISFERIQQSREKISLWYENNRIVFITGYFLFYILSVVFAMPGAALLTILAGAIFGLGMGVVIVSFASSIGALLSFLAARYLFRDWVEAKFGEKLQTIHQGLEREGAFYLFTMRLIPIFPYFIINPVFGLTRIRAWTFYWVSQVGMFAGTVVFVNAGTQLAQIDSARDVVSFRLLGSFALIGIFPLVVKKLIHQLRHAKGPEKNPTESSE